MLAYGPLFFGLLVAAAVLLGFAALWRVMRSRDPVDARLQDYGTDAQGLLGDSSDLFVMGRRRTWPGVNRLLAGFGLGPQLALLLARADVPLSAAEYALIVLGLAVLGLVVGTLRSGLLVGLALAVLGGALPLLFLRFRARRRQQAFTDQLPEVLTLLVGGLRAGYGLSQAVEMLVDNLPPPASTEFARVLHAVELGLPVQQALGDMADRVGTDDIALVVTAINAQYEMGGNLAQTLETISQTVRDRLRLLREIRVLTSQQRFTGYVLAVWPIFLAVAIYLINADYMRRLLELPWLIAVAIVMQILGFLVIRRIVDIEV